MGPEWEAISSSAKDHDALRILPVDTAVIVKHQRSGRGCAGLDGNKHNKNKQTNKQTKSIRENSFCFDLW